MVFNTLVEKLDDIFINEISFFNWTDLSYNFMLEVHGRPDDLQLFEHPLHGHFLDCLVDDVVHLVLEVVQVQVQQVGQGRVLAHHKVNPEV